MIYTTGTIAGSGSTLTGTGTNFTAAGSLIRNGCTVIVLTSPPQAFQITGVTSATQLAVSPAVNPAIPAGTRYAILLSDSLSVDGLAQDIAETFKMYQAYMSGFADVMTGSGNVTITINGTSVTVPAQKSLAQKAANGAVPVTQGGTGSPTAEGARTNLGLILQSSNADSTTGRVLTVGSFGLGSTNLTPVLSDNRLGFGAYTSQMLLGGIGNNVSLISLPFNEATTYQLVVPTMLSRAPRLYLRVLNTDAQYNGQICEVYTTTNTTKASDGTLKAASPVIQVFHDGSAKNNEESEGCTVKRTGIGEYLVEGCMGLNSDAAWGGIDGGFDIPKDRNGQALVWLDYEVNADGSILVKTYHRTYPDAPAFARNEKDGFSNGDPIDIPADQFVSVRVEMPENSVYNTKVRASEESGTLIQQEPDD